MISVRDDMNPEREVMMDMFRMVRHRMSPMTIQYHSRRLSFLKKMHRQMVHFFCHFDGMAMKGVGC
jgi:hypothetical protein